MTDAPGLSDVDLADLGLGAAAVRPLPGGDTCHAWRVRLTDGRDVFAKRAPAGAAGMLPLEAAGLRWLGTAARTPEVVAVSDRLLVLAWSDPAPPDPASAAALGADLAQLHSARAESFGSPPPGSTASSGWVGRVPVPFGDHSTWERHYVADRLQPTAAAAAAAGGLAGRDRDVIDELCGALIATPGLAGPPQPPTPIHGDLWAGNVLWQPDGAMVIDPAAVGGHPETDLAMLHLFGLPHLDELITAYRRIRPLPAGWRDRIPLHQVFPLLVHAVVFGPGYGRQAAAAAATVLRAARRPH